MAKQRNEGQGKLQHSPLFKQVEYYKINILYLFYGFL